MNWSPLARWVFAGALLMTILQSIQVRAGTLFVRDIYWSMFSLLSNFLVLMIITLMFRGIMGIFKKGLFKKEVDYYREGRIRVTNKRVYFQGLSLPLSWLLPVQVVDLGDSSKDRYQIPLYNDSNSLVNTIMDADLETMTQVAQAINKGIGEVAGIEQSQGYNEGNPRVEGGRIYYDGISRPLYIFQPVSVEMVDSDGGTQYRIILIDKADKIVGSIDSEDETSMNQLAQAINRSIAELAARE